MTTQLVTLQYNDQITVNFTQDAWFNASDVAKSFGKRVNDWLSLDSTKEYISKLHAALFPEIQLPENLVIKKNQLVRVKGGAPETGGGTGSSGLVMVDRKLLTSVKSIIEHLI